MFAMCCYILAVDHHTIHPMYHVHCFASVTFGARSGMAGEVEMGVTCVVLCYQTVT